MTREVRLLICHDCATVEELRDYQGPPERDYELAALVVKHRSAGIPHTGLLGRVPEVDWDKREARDEILKKITANAPGRGSGLGVTAYTMVDTFKDDAFKCWEQHLRTPDCSDYMSDSKRLIPDTAEERKELGLVPASRYDTEGGQATVYLCQYCPVHSLVQQARRKKAGLYDK